MWMRRVVSQQRKTIWPVLEEVSPWWVEERHWEEKRRRSITKETVIGKGGWCWWTSKSGSVEQREGYEGMKVGLLVRTLIVCKREGLVYWIRSFTSSQCMTRWAQLGFHQTVVFPSSLTLFNQSTSSTLTRDLDCRTKYQSISFETYCPNSRHTQPIDYSAWTTKIVGKN